MRVKKSFTRKSGNRDAKLIVIATEGAKTESKYFQDLTNSDRFTSPKIHIEILKRDPTQSDPKRIVESLNEFKRQYKLIKNLDELWVICDVDRWGDAKLAAVDQLCRQKDYSLAVSNPCFESWLLLHITRFSDYTDDEASRLTTCRNLENEIRRINGSYNKSNLDTSVFFGGINRAIEQARTLDNPGHSWPNTFGSKVFNVVESLLNSK